MIGFLDILAFIILAVLLVAAIFIFIKLGELPGKVASKRHHPQADAINICGWLGILTLGLLWPIAIVWAYTRSQYTLESESVDNSDINARMDALENQLNDLKSDKDQSQ